MRKDNPHSARFAPCLLPSAVQLAAAAEHKSRKAERVPGPPVTEAGPRRPTPMAFLPGEPARLVPGTKVARSRHPPATKTPKLPS